MTIDWTTQEDDWSLICLRTGTTRANWVHLADNSSSGKTLGAAGTTTYYYTAIDRTFTNSNAGGSGLTILGTVYLYIPSGKTITCTGTHANGTTGAGAGIELTEGNTLYLIGSGRLNATGGNAANGSNGVGGGDASTDQMHWVWSGAGGRGGNGGGGAGAGIGSRGANGGAGGAGGAAIQEEYDCSPTTGNVGSNGQNGGTAAAMGTLYIYDGSQALTPQTDIHGGGQGTTGGNGGAGGRHVIIDDGGPVWFRTMGGGGGGAGGGFGGAGSNIGTGGPGGGGGGGGASGSIDKKQAAAASSFHYGYYKVGAFGGNPGVNGDGTTTAGNGANTELNDTENMCINYANWYLDNDGWSDGVDHRAAGGNSGNRGSASTSSSAHAVAVAWPTQGTGIEDNPFIVSSTDDWNGFANAVTGGCTFSGQYVQMNSNISVSAMVGADETNSFQGTFLGDGHTLTVNYNTSAESTAPFRFARNAVIKNLHVDGTIATSAKFAGGIVGKSSGTLNITGCRSSVSINSSVSGDGTHGGIVARIAGGGNTIIIDGCVFDGSFATTASTNNCGGFIGWPVTDTPTIENSLMKPSSVDAGMLTNTFARWYTGDGGIYEPTITNCYYVATTNLPTDQGTEAVATDTAPANLGSLVEDYGMVKAYQNGILASGTYYVAPATVTLADNADNSTAITDADGYVANVTLAARTLYKDGAWNTICLPFDVTIAGSPLAGATARPLTSASISGTTLTLTFGDAVTTL
ncbi:MAG: PE-PGRS family protein, partial [bacterium F083]